MQTFLFEPIDVFTRKPFWGDPFAVVIRAEGLISEKMQRVATWTNLSEPTFILRETWPFGSDLDYNRKEVVFPAARKAFHSLAPN